MNTEQQLNLISKAWGRQRGYCFFPWIDQPAETKEERIRGYHEGPAFMWPKDKEKILAHLEAHDKDDVYWCPMLFEKPRRRMELAMDEHALWADLDEVDPRGIEDYPPTIAWETSPGRYQALWVVTGGIMGASWAGNENQRLTYYLGADLGGWDTTQLLRIPGRPNRKFDYWQNGTKEVQGEVLWTNGRRYLVDDFVDLPEVQSVGQVSEILEHEVDHVDRHEVWGRVRLKVSKRVRELVSSREADGDRSSALWEIERELADAGCTVVEIVAVVRATVWNKYQGRSDELRRLTIEAAKAMEMREEKSAGGDALEPADDEPKPEPRNLFDIVADVRNPEWLVQGIIAVGSGGFIGGQPKSWKSWIALDLALSVSTGLPFLDHFPVRRPGPVLYVQEEDSGPMVKSRLTKVWPSKQADKMKMNADGSIEWHPPDEKDKPKIAAMVREGVTLSDPGWQAWFDEQLAKGYNGEPYVMLVVDTLISTAGEVNENSSQEMNNKIFKPLRTLANKHDVAIMIVHHMRKGVNDAGTRGGQLMLGSTANHAFVDDALYIKLAKGDLLVERESKNTISGSFRIKGVRRKGWEPAVTDDRMADNEDEVDLQQPPEKPRAVRQRAPRRRSDDTALKALKKLGGTAPTSAIAALLDISSSGAYKKLSRLEQRGKVSSDGSKWIMS